MTTSTETFNWRGELLTLAFATALAIGAELAIKGRFSILEPPALHIAFPLFLSRLFQSSKARWISFVLWFAYGISITILGMLN